MIEIEFDDEGKLKAIKGKCKKSELKEQFQKVKEVLTAK